MLSMLLVYRKLLLSLLLFVLISVLILNLFVVSDFNLKNKIIVKDICQKLVPQNHLNYSLSQRLTNKHNYHNNHINQYLANSHDIETTFVNISDNVFIYSAFETTNDMIVMIGFAKNCKQVSDDYNFYHYNNSYKVEEYEYLCGFGSTILIKTVAKLEYLPESHDYYYSAIKVQCKRPKLFNQNLSINRVKLIERPKLWDKSHANIESDFVFIVNHNNKYKTVYNNNSNYGLDSHLKPNRSNGSHGTALPSSYASPKQLVVCVRPLYGNISAINLLEFIAYYRLNGINRIVIYNSISSRQISNQTKQILDLLSSIESVEVMPFIIPNNEESRPIIHANGQLTAIHDCLYRFADYIQIHVDFDEYLMPYNNGSIKEFMLSEEISQYRALVVQTVLFCNEFNEQLANRSDSLLITNFNRQKTVWPHKIRSKVIIIRAKLISQMGIHDVWQSSQYYSQLNSYPILYSKSDQALIYHYRQCCDMIQPYFANIIHFHTINDHIIKDESMKAFLNRVKQFIDKYIEIIY